MTNSAGGPLPSHQSSCILSTPIGPLKIIASGKVIVEVRVVPPVLDGAGPFTNRSIPLSPESPLLQEACRQLDEYFSRRRKSFQLPIKQAGTPFQQQVWQVLQTIPYGQTRSYQDIAQTIGKPKAMRAVGQANNRNKILIVIPCHRVIHKNGQLGGFEPGLDAKRWLLKLEGNAGSLL